MSRKGLIKDSTKTSKLQISHRHSSGAVYKIDIGHWDGKVNNKLISVKVPNNYGMPVLWAIKNMLEEGVMEIHGTFSANKTEKLHK